MKDLLVSQAMFAAQYYEQEDVAHTMIPMKNILLEYARPQPGERVVDIACGTGVIARHVAPLVGDAGSIVALDIDPAMLDVGRSLPMPLGAVIEWRQSAACNLPLPEAGYDLAICQHGLQFFPDPAAALHEIARVLIPGGRLVICVWGQLDQNPFSQPLLESCSHHLNLPVGALTTAFSLGDTRELRRLLESAMFTHIQVVSQEMTIRQPWNENYCHDTLKSIVAAVPAIASMTDTDFTALAEFVEADAGQQLRRFVHKGYAYVPMTANIATAIRL